MLYVTTVHTVYPKKYAHGFCFAVLCCGYTSTDFPISIRLTSLALWQSNDCPSASKATLMNMDKYFMWIQYERLHNHNKAKHNKTVCIFLGIYCIWKYADGAHIVVSCGTLLPIDFAPTYVRIRSLSDGQIPLCQRDDLQEYGYEYITAYITYHCYLNRNNSKWFIFPIWLW